MSRHRRGRVVVDYERRAPDDAALVYFSGDLQYRWTGSPADPIEVIPDGDSVVSAVIRTRAGGDQPLVAAWAEWWRGAYGDVSQGLWPGAVTHWYQHICDEWAEQIKVGAEPQWVNDRG